MKSQSGRSLIEVIGVLAITGVMTAAALGAYRMIRANQVRSIADAELQQIAQDIKILMEMRGSYQGLSIDYLIKAGALQSNKQPIGGENWSITSSFDGKTFSINLVDLTTGECEYFSSAKPSWAIKVIVNGFETGVTDNCFDSNINQVSFVAE
jgi:Tfp pilus assembly protein PilE